MNNYIATVPFDLYELHLFQMVARHGSFTKAAVKAGLTQSAMTRQIQAMETKLGVVLFERTTRQVSLTAAGDFLLDRSRAILEQVGKLAADLEGGANIQARQLQVGICRTIGLAYLPGFFVQFQKNSPGTRTRVVQESSKRILELLREGEIDVGIVGGCAKVPRGLALLHEFEDSFTGIFPGGESKRSAVPTRLEAFFKEQAGTPWLVLRRDTTTGAALNHWLRGKGIDVESSIETDNFDLIVNLVSLGLGFSIVPHRSLPLYLSRRSIVKVPLVPKFSRRIWIVARKSNAETKLVAEFAKNVLF